MIHRFIAHTNNHVAIHKTLLVGKRVCKMDALGQFRSRDNGFAILPDDAGEHHKTQDKIDDNTT